MSLSKNIKNNFIFILLMCQFAASAQIDTFSSGMIFEDETYDTLQRTDPNDGAKADLPSWVNLERFCPTVRNQGKISSCVGWSTGYGAMTIQRAVLSDCKDKKKINQNAHSALFLFNQIKKGDCVRGSKISDALEFLKSNGNCLAGHFDTDINDCSKVPNEKIKKLAKRYAIEDYLTLFGTKDDPRKKVFQVKKTLAQKRPVVIGMSVRRNFYELKGAKFWHPNIGNTAHAGGHAMVVVGYDDRKEAFRIFNSWGKEWGDNGFIWVKYQDFGKYCKYGYVLYLIKKPLLEEKQVKLAANVMAGRGGPRASLTRTGISSRRSATSKSRRKPSANQSKKPRPRNRPRPKTNKEKIDSRIASGNVKPQNSARSRTRKPIKSEAAKPKNRPPKVKPTTTEEQNDNIREVKEELPAKTTDVEITAENAPKTEKASVEPLTSEEEDSNDELDNEPEEVEEEITEVVTEEEVSAEELEKELDEILEIQPLLEFSGDFVFREFTGFNKESSQPEFAIAPVKIENDVYKTTQSIWEVGQRFQLLASTKTDEQYLYIFSIDSGKKIHFHWPRQEGLNEKFSGENKTALMMNNGSDVIVPGTNKVLKLANAGTDRLVVLFSKKKIRGIKQLAEIAAKKSGDFMPAFRHTLGDYAVPRSEITYFPDRIGFEAVTRGKGYIVPLLLEVSAQ